MVNITATAQTAATFGLADATCIGATLDRAWLAGFGIFSVLDHQDSKTRGSYNGTAGVDLIRAGKADDSLYGLGGDDVLLGGAGRNYLDGGEGADLLLGGAGDDTYMFSGGADLISDSAGNNDKLYLRSSVKPSDLTFAAVGRDLIISDLRLGSSLRIVDHFGVGRVEALRLGDKSEINLSMAIAATAGKVGAVVRGGSKNDALTGTDRADDVAGGSGNDVLRGLLGDDMLLGDAGTDMLHGDAGSDMLDGGSGNDVLNGGAGHDTYLMSAGSDRITDASGVADVLMAQAGVDFADLTFTASGGDLVVTDITSGAATTIVDQFGAGKVETLRFADGTEFDMTGNFQVKLGFDLGAATDWGGVDPNLYRGTAVAGRSASISAPSGPAESNPNQAAVVTVALGTTVAQLEDMIAKAAAGTTFMLEKGTYVFDERLDIRRGDITLKGAGEGETRIAATVTGTDVIRVQAPWQKEAFGNIEGSEAKLNTTLKIAASEHATTVTLASTTNIKAGDFLEISVKYNEFRDDASDGFKGTLVEVESVNKVTGRVTLAHEVGFEASAGATVRAVELLHNVVLGDFTIDFGTPLHTVDPYRYENNNPQYVGGEAGMGNLGNRAVFLNGVTDSALNNVTIVNAGSNGVVVREAVDISVDGLTVDGVQNLGEGGNGYGLEIARTYWSDFENLMFDGFVRHAVTFAKDGSSAYNNVHVLSSTANIDFHGGPDYKNIYYVEDMNLTQLKDDYAFNAIDYRDENNESENTVIFDNFVGADAIKITSVDPNYVAINYSGHDAGSSTNNYSGARDDIVYMSSKGGAVNTAAGNDTIHAGTGRDAIRTGAGNDRIVFDDKNGHDQILDFSAKTDKILVAADVNDSGFASAKDIFASAHSDGHGNVVLDLGGGHDVLLVGVQMSQLTIANFDIVGL